MAPLLIFIFFCPPSVVGAEAPSDVASRLAKLTTSLRRVVVEFPYQAIPLDANDKLFALKRELRALVETVLVASPPTHSAAEIRGVVVKALHDAGVELGRTDNKAALEAIRAADPRPGLNEDTRGIFYGDILEFSIVRPQEHPDLIVATITVSVECGDDTSLYIWQRSGDGWKNVLTADAQGYKAISGAQWEFQYKISKKKPDGSFLVVTGGITPWCTSNWRGLRYSAYLIQQDSSTTEVLRDERSIFCCDYELEVTTDGFSLTFSGSDPDPDRAGFVRTFHLRYAVEQGTPRLLPEQTPREVLETYKELATTNAEFYKPLVAGTLADIAETYRQNRQFEEQQRSLEEAAEIYRELAKSDPIHRIELAQTLESLAHSYGNTREMEKAETLLQEILLLHKELTSKYWMFDQSDIARTLSDLGGLYWKTRQMEEAERAYLEALQIHRDLAKKNQGRYQRYVAETLYDLGGVYRDNQKIREAEEALQESLAIRRALGADNPKAYRVALAESLNGLADFYVEVHRAAEAKEQNEEAISISRQLWQEDPRWHGDLLARTLITAMKLLANSDRSARCALADEARAVAYDGGLKNLIQGILVDCSGLP